MFERNEAKKQLNQKVDLMVGVIDSMTLTTIFTMFLKEVMQRLLDEVAKFVLFPLAAGAAIIKAMLAWRQAQLEQGKNGTVVRAIVETVAALAITTAVVGALAFTAIFATISPIIFTATLGAKTLFHLGAAAYYWGKSKATNDPDKKIHYSNMARGNLVATVALTLATVAVAFVMIAAKPIVSILGIAAGVIGGAFGLYNLLKKPSKNAAIVPSTAEDKREDAPQLSPSTKMQHQFRPRRRLESKSHFNPPAEIGTAQNSEIIPYWVRSEPRPIPVKQKHTVATGRTFARSL